MSAINTAHPRIHYHSGDSDHSPGFDESLAYRRLKRNALRLISANASFRYLGDDNVIENMALGHGFARGDLVILKLLFKRQVLTMVCVPDRLWAQRAAAIAALKANARTTNRQIVLIREAFIQRKAGSAAQGFGASSAVSVTYEDKMAALAHLLETGGATLANCASALNHATPVAAVLQMASMGLLEIDLDRGFDRHSQVTLPGFTRLAA